MCKLTKAFLFYQKNKRVGRSQPSDIETLLQMLGIQTSEGFVWICQCLFWIDIYSVDTLTLIMNFGWTWLNSQFPCHHWPTCMLKMNVSGQFTQAVSHKVVNSSLSVLMKDWSFSGFSPHTCLLWASLVWSQIKPCIAQMKYSRRLNDAQLPRVVPYLTQTSGAENKSVHPNRNTELHFSKN